MKNLLNKLLLMVLMIPIAIGLQAQGDFKILFNESFEDGAIPQGWEIVHEKGNHDWKIVGSGGYKSDHYISLRNETSAQERYSTLLVSPVVDVSTVFQPILVFAHRQMQWTGDNDTLRVMYRTSPDKGWEQLYEFGAVVDDWKMDTVFLNSAMGCKTYQIALRGTDNLGRGIDIDNLQMRSFPRCEQPSNIMINDVTNGGGILTWYAGFEAINIAVRVSAVELTPEQLNGTEETTTLVVDTLLNGIAVNLPLKDLASGTNYFAYIKTICQNEESLWSAPYEFSTTNLVQVPYYEDFNMEYTAGYLNMLPTWTRGTSTDEYIPCINTSTVRTDLHHYSRDGSTCLCFTESATSYGIPANEYAYAASPQLDVERIQDLQVTFEARFSYTQANAYKITLGVMTDPKNYGSFTPIQTFECFNFREYYTFTAFLDSYQGEGKYIAFASDFPESNMIFIDNLKVEYAGDCRSPIDVMIKVPSATALEVSWDNSGADKADFVVTKTYHSILDEFPIVDDDIVMVINDVPSSEPYLITGLTPKEEYYIYVRNSKGEQHSPWSAGLLRRMPAKVTGDSHFIDFEIDKNDSTTWYSCLPYKDWSSNFMHPDVLALYAGTGTTQIPCSENLKPSSTAIPPMSTWYLKLTVALDGGQYSCAVFPEIDDIRTFRARFYSCIYSPGNTNKMVVGIMSDASDFNTFYPLDTILPEYNKHNLYTVEFDKYPADKNGHFFAIVNLTSINDKDTYSYVRIDDLTLEKIPECREPYTVAVETAQTTATLSWDLYADSYNVRVYDKVLTPEQLANADFPFTFSADNSTDMPFTITGLKSSGHKYYYYIQPVCGNRTGNWTTGGSFVTECYVREPLPYHQDFDGYTHEGGKTPQLAVPCVGTTMHYTSSTYYPYLYTSAGYVYNGDASLYLSAGTSSSYPPYTYISFPDLDVESISETQISFVLESYYVSYILQVGVMTDPLDISTFEKCGEVSVEATGKFEEKIVAFDQYKGKGRYIALYLPQPTSSSQYLYVDSVVIEPIQCPKASKLDIISASSVSAELKWHTPIAPDSWEIVVSTSELTDGQLDNASVDTDGVVYIGVSETNITTVTNLTANHHYYYYVRSVCGGEKGHWPFKCGDFHSGCEVTTLGEGSIQDMEDFGTGSGSYPNCWSVGNYSVDPKTATAYQFEYIPYCAVDYSHTGHSSLYFSTTKTYNGGYAITPPLDVTDIKDVEVSLWAAMTNGKYTISNRGQLVVGVVSSPYDLATFVPTDTIDIYADEQNYRLRLDRYITDDPDNGGRYVMFLSEYDMNNNVFIDDVRFDLAPDCAAPVSLCAIDTTAVSAHVAWRLGTAPFTVQYADHLLSQDELAAGAGVTVGTTSADNIEITGLSGLTTYFVYVKSDCNDNWSAPLRIKTECPESYDLPFLYDFNQNPFTGTSINPVCWNTHYTKINSETLYPSIVGGTSAMIGNATYIYANNANECSYAVTPLLNVENVADCYVSFYSKGNVQTAGKSRSLIVGIVEDVTDGASIVATFHPIDTIVIVNKGFAKYLVPLTSDFSGKYVGFTTSYALNTDTSTAGVVSSTSGGVYVDNVEIDIFGTCPRPDFVTVTTLSDSEIGGTFQKFGDATAWQGVCVVSGSEIGDAELIDFTEEKFSFTNLTARTEYDIYVRSVCGDANYSKWSTPITVKTTAIPLSSFPYSTGFETADDNSQWETVSIQTNSWYIGTGASKTGQGGMYVSSNNGNSAHYVNTATSTAWAYIPLALEEGEYTFEFDWNCYGESTYDFMRVGLLPTSVILNDGDPNIVVPGGDLMTMNGTLQGTPASWISLEGLDANNKQLYKLNLTDTTSANPNHGWNHNSVRILLKEPGIFNFVVLWKNDGGGGQRPTPSAILDNLFIKHSSCVQPEKLKVESSSADETTISWTPINDQATGYEVFVTNNRMMFTPYEAQVGDTVQILSVSEPRVTITGLAEWSISYVFVRSLCSDDRYSDWSKPIAFRTECQLKRVGTIFHFDSDDEIVIDDADLGPTYGRQPGCFAVGHSQMVASTTNGSNFPYIKVDTYGETSRSGLNVLNFGNSAATGKGGYIVLPAFDVESYEGLQLSFWMRPVTHNRLSGKVSNSNVAASYARTLTIGYMTDQNDFSTFTKITDVVYPYTASDITSQTLLEDDPNGNDWWVKEQIILPKECGKYVVIYNSVDYSQAKNQMYVDDLTLERIPDCPTPTAIKFSNIRATQVTMSFTSQTKDGATWEIRMSRSAGMTDLRTETLTSADDYTIKDLQPNTRYYLQMRQICSDEDASPWSDVHTFVTPMATPFYESFTRNVKVPDGWRRSNSGRYFEILNGSEVFSNYIDETYIGWAHENELGSGHEYVEISIGTSTNDRWTFTPDIDMTGKDNATLTFDLAVTASGSVNLPAPSDLMTDPAIHFIVAISDDAGVTYTRANATMWGNDDDTDRPFSAISNKFSKIEINMTPYNGKVVRIAFCVATDKRENGIVSKAEVHIDNVRINNLVSVHEEDDVCETNDYEGYGFKRHYSELSVGVNKMSRFALAANDLNPDTIYNLDLSVNTLNRKYFDGEICEGGVYTEHNFNASEPGVHKQKFVRAGKCDSVVYLNLTVNPILRSTERMTICQGMKYEWNGMTLERSDVYEVTLTSKTTNCDSVATLVLSVTEAQVTPDEVSVCFGETYNVGDIEVSRDGVYRDTITDGDGCMSITELTVSFLPDYRYGYSATICAGDEYMDENFVGVSKTGTYTIPLKSKVHGCDSTITLNLMVLGGDTTRLSHQITTDQLPYTIEGTDITYDVNTAPGVYVDTILIEADECEEVLIHTLTIEKGVGVDVASIRSLILTPNPVHRGETVRVALELSTADLDGTVVSVFDLAGAEISRTTSPSKPITIVCDFASGVYVVRITLATGEVYQGKIIVR